MLAGIGFSVNCRCLFKKNAKTFGEVRFSFYLCTHVEVSCHCMQDGVSLTFVGEYRALAVYSYSLETSEISKMYCLNKSADAYALA